MRAFGVFNVSRLVTAGALAAFVLTMMPAPVENGGMEGRMGSFIAWDPVAGEVVWEVDERFAVWSGALTTAGDLALLVRAAATYPEIREYSTTKGFTARFKKPRYTLRYGNTNVLLHRKSWDIDVTKTGYLNEAGRCLVMMTQIQGRDTVMIMLNSYGKRTPIGDAGRIKRWITTGKSGKISDSARHYQRHRARGRKDSERAHETAPPVWPNTAGYMPRVKQ